MSYGVGHRCSLKLAFLWLWHRPAGVATIGPLAWEPPNAMGAALKKLFFSLDKIFFLLYSYKK